MKKAALLLALIVILTSGAGCSVQDAESANSSLESNYYAAINDIFRWEFSVVLFDFGSILKKASEAETKEDIAYLQGRAEGYSINGGFNMLSIISLNDSYKSKISYIIRPELHQLLSELLAAMETYMGNLDSKVLKKNNTVKLLELHSDFLRLYELERSINDDGYNDRNETGRFLKSMNSMIEIMKGTKWE